jgi:hypothetical protein
MLHKLLEQYGFTPLIKPVKNDPTDEGEVRIVEINDTSFFVTSDMRTRRRNIKINSEQFKKLSEGITDHDQISKLYNKHKDSLTDINIEEKGYF